MFFSERIAWLFVPRHMDCCHYLGCSWWCCPLNDNITRPTLFFGPVFPSVFVFILTTQTSCVWYRPFKLRHIYSFPRTWCPASPKKKIIAPTNSMVVTNYTLLSIPYIREEKNISAIPPTHSHTCGGNQFETGWCVSYALPRSHLVSLSSQPVPAYSHSNNTQSDGISIKQCVRCIITTRKSTALTYSSPTLSYNTRLLFVATSNINIDEINNNKLQLKNCRSNSRFNGGD